MLSMDRNIPVRAMPVSTFLLSESPSSYIKSPPLNSREAATKRRMSSRKTPWSQRYGHVELVFGIVAPVGIDYAQVSENLASQLTEFGYKSNVFKLSDQIGILSKMMGITCELHSSPEFLRIESHMKAANKLYGRFNEHAPEDEKNALLALVGVNEIAKVRAKEAASRALYNQAHIFLTLKRPEEINYLRKIYGVGLHIIGVFATEEERLKYLIRRKHVTDEEAATLIEHDENDRLDNGQRTGDSFHLADVFVDVGVGADDWKRQLGRYLDLLFSHPYESPSRDEQAMFLAHSASLRSAQLGRQVGAAITTEDGDLLSIGCNEVPKAFGGQYWDGSLLDERDHRKGIDSNDVEKNKILDEIMRVMPDGYKDSSRLRDEIRKTSLFSITEFGRATHAEMEAILSCSRRGISTKGAVLYTTTFPCHNCARHIIGAGIKKVVYIEPYPKSKAADLHQDAISLTEETRDCNPPQKVPFVPFVGVSPRKYAELFTVKPMYGKEVDRKLKVSGNAINWERKKTGLRLQMMPLSYIEREAFAISSLAETLEQPALGFGDSKILNQQEDPS